MDVVMIYGGSERGNPKLRERLSASFTPKSSDQISVWCSYLPPLVMYACSNLINDVIHLRFKLIFSKTMESIEVDIML